MKFKSGKHEGQEYAYVLLKYADHAVYMMETYPDGVAAKELKRLVAVFDGKPFTAKCMGCTNTATRASAYGGTPSLYFWCDDCDIYDQGALPGKLTVIRTFSQAVRLAASTSGEKRSVIKTLSKAKGCPSRLSQAAAAAYLP